MHLEAQTKFSIDFRMAELPRPIESSGHYPYNQSEKLEIHAGPITECAAQLFRNRLNSVRDISVIHPICAQLGNVETSYLIATVQ